MIQNRAALLDGVKPARSQEAMLKSKEVAETLSRVDSQGLTEEKQLEEKIKDTKTFKWKERIEAMQRIAELGKDIEPEAFNSFFEPLCPGFCEQVTDGRSAVV